MRQRIAKFQKIGYLICLVFLILPFQKHILHNAFKKFSHIPTGLVIPEYFSKHISFFPSFFLLIALVGILLFYYRERWEDFFWSGPSKYLTLFFLTALFSIGSSSTSNYLLSYARLLEMTLIAGLFNSIKISFNKATVVHFIKVIAWIIFILSLFECCVALLQYFSQERLGLRFLGECTMQRCIFPMPGGKRWIFDTLFNIQRENNFLARASGTFPHPNIFSGFIFCALMSTFYLYFTQTRKKYQLFLLFGIVLQIIVLTVIFSRAAIIATIFGSALWLLLQAKNPEKQNAIKKLAVGVLVIASLAVFLFYPQLFTRGGIVNYNTLVKNSDSERLIYQKIAVEMIKERPFLGVGFNNFQIESHRFFPKGKILPSKVHSIYLLITCETGLCGALFFFLFLFSLLKRAYLSVRSQEGLFVLSLFLGLLFIGACDFYLIQFPHGQILLFGFAGLLAVVSDRSSFKNKAKTPIKMN